ncbi:MAG TPA: DUF1737 domain-containing protein [Dermatophilaceae bacterium]|nr:DUF1737 domain-containing protein [Dermatophilaceae bacterium]
MTDEPRLPRYRLLTGPDDSTFCRRVSAALELGYDLYGDPALTVKDGAGYAAQAVIWRRPDPPPAAPAAGDSATG